MKIRTHVLELSPVVVEDMFGTAIPAQGLTPIDVTASDEIFKAQGSQDLRRLLSTGFHVGGTEPRLFLQTSAGVDVPFNDALPFLDVQTLPSTGNNYDVPLVVVAPADGEVPAWDSGAGQWVPQELSVFGDGYVVDEDLSRSSTSGGWMTKVQVTVPATAGTYIVEWSCNIDSEGVGRTRVRDVTAGSNLTEILDSKPTDSSDDNRRDSGFITIVQSGATRDVALQFRSKDGNEIGVRTASIQAWRIL